MKNRLSLILFSFIILLGLFLRLYHFDGPVADWHSWRQADTSSVSRTFVTNGFDLLHPTYHDLSNVPSGMDNPKGYRFVEFPLFNLLQAGGFVLFDFFTLEEWGRIVSIGASLLSMTMIYLIVRKYYNEVAALFASFFFAVIPFSFYYGRTILPDELMVAASLSGIYFFGKWAENNEQKTKNKNQFIFYVVSILFTAAAFLLKPYALFFTLPMVVLAYRYFGFSALKKWQLWLFLVLSALPLIGWRLWMTQFPEGIPVNAWLFNGGNIRFKGAYFYWVFADRIGRLIFGYYGLTFFFLGTLALLTKKAIRPLHSQPSIFFFSFLLSSLCYLVIIARGNVQHDYYQILIVPSLVIFAGIGASFLLSLPRKDYYPFVGVGLVTLLTIFMIMFGWYHIRDYYNINNPAIITAGQTVATLTPKDAQVIANYNGDTTFLYQTQRSGWASYTYDMPKMIELGADYLVLVHPNEEDFQKFDTYEIVTKTDDYALWKLH